MSVDLLADLEAAELPELSDVRLCPISPTTAEPLRYLVVSFIDRERDATTGYAVSEWSYSLVAVDRDEARPMELLELVIRWALTDPDAASWGAVTAVTGPVPSPDPAHPSVVRIASATITLRG